MGRESDPGSVERAGAGGGAEARRLSVCYMVPGSDLDPTAGPSRNAAQLAQALARWADVTLAFRRVPPGLAVDGIRLAEIDSRATPSGRPGDDSAITGMGYWEFATYLRSIRRFVRTGVSAYDAVLEKTWLLSGYAASLARKRGVPGIPVENYVPIPGKGGSRGPVAYARHAAGRFLAGRALRDAPLIVAETHHLRRAMESAWRLPTEKFRVIGVGIDRERFRHRDPAAARRNLGVDPDILMMLYVGILDRAHDLLPAIDALVAAPPERTELHVVGDGPARAECQRRSSLGSRGARVIFHGTVPHDRVPAYIAASDLCLAPYDAASFPGGEVAYSILKIREYLSSGRSVASIPSGTITELVEHGRTGFLFDNDAASWRAFLAAPPARDRLRAMGEAAARTELPTWDDVGRSVHRVIEEAVSGAASDVRR